MRIKALALASALCLAATPTYAQVISGPAGGGSGGSGGSGDFSGPASSTADDFVQFSGTGGKTGKDGGYGPASFAAAGVVTIVTGSNPTTNAASWAAFTQYTIGGSGRTITLPASSGLSVNGGLAVDANTNSVTLAANAADTITWAGSTTGTGGSVTLPAGSIYFVSTDAAGKIYVSGRQAQGNGAKVQLSTGTTTTNNCAKFDANGNTVDAGSACGSGSATYHKTYIPNNWLHAVDGAPALTGTPNVIGANVVSFVPFTVTDTFTVGALGLSVTTLSVGGSCYAAIYDNTNTTTAGYPGTALMTSGAMSTTTAVNVNATVTGTAQLTPGIYWAAAVCDNGTAKLKAFINAGGAFADSVGAGSQNALDANSGASGVKYTASMTAGTFTNNPTITAAANDSTAPVVQIKVASKP